MLFEFMGVLSVCACDTCGQACMSVYAWCAQLFCVHAPGRRTLPASLLAEPGDTELRQPQRLSQLLAMRGAAQHLDPGFSLQISPLGKAGGIQHLGQPHLSGLTQA